MCCDGVSHLGCGFTIERRIIRQHTSEQRNVCGCIGPQEHRSGFFLGVDLFAARHAVCQFEGGCLLAWGNKGKLLDSG